MTLEALSDKHLAQKQLSSRCKKTVCQSDYVHLNCLGGQKDFLCSCILSVCLNQQKDNFTFYVPCESEHNNLRSSHYNAREFSYKRRLLGNDFYLTSEVTATRKTDMLC
jgi:hypothetical protein